MFYVQDLNCRIVNEDNHDQGIGNDKRMQKTNKICRFHIFLEQLKASSLGNLKQIIIIMCRWFLSPSQGMERFQENFVPLYPAWTPVVKTSFLDYTIKCGTAAERRIE